MLGNLLHSVYSAEARVIFAFMHRRDLLWWPGVLVLASVLSGACFFGSNSNEEPAPLPDAVGFQREQGQPFDPSPVAQSAPEPPLGPVVVTYGLPFVWPAQGPLTSLMSPEHPNGIDIGLDAGGSRRIRAAAAGTVIQAGGGDNEPLGLSIVIAHGNGIETTYGHLSEISVSQGDKVATGEALGLGGATGIASGVHLHFEVRWDGKTVDPLDVLPGVVPETRIQEFDCDSGRMILPAGASAVLDLSGLLSPEERLINVDSRVRSPDFQIQSADEDRTKVQLATALDFAGPERLEEHSLDFTIDSPNGNRSVICRLAVQHRSVPTTFYIRAATPFNDQEGHEGFEPDSTHTPVPTPTSRLEPRYDAPITANPTAVPPEYAAPGGSGPDVQQPSYVLPQGSSP